MKSRKVGIIGGGIAGCGVALELADKGFIMSLFEAENDILTQTSDASSCCFGAGFYYLDIRSAITSLETCVRLIRYLKKMTGSSFQLNEAGEFHRINYVITNDSQLSSARVLDVFEALKSRYESLIKEDKDNAVLGLSDEFYRVANKDKFRDLLNQDKTSMVIETCDTLFDWPALKNYLSSRVKTHPNIKLYLNTTVKAVNSILSPRRSLFGRVVILNNGSQHNVDYLINSTWRNVERLNRSAGFFRADLPDNQVTCIAVVRLPVALVGRSFFVDYENGCFLTAGPNGIGYLTYAPVSQLARFGANSFQAAEDQFIRDMSRDDFKEKLGRAIIQGSATFIPPLNQASLIDLKIGIIKANKQSQKRVDFLASDFIVNEAPQHTFWRDNASKISQIIEAHENRIDKNCQELVGSPRARL